jgi:hypothetical protein
MSSASLRRAVLRLSVGVAAATLATSLVGCQPEPSPTASPGASTSATATPSASASASASPSPTETAQADDITMPTACEQLYSPAMLTSLQGQAPLNDPGVTMTSTQNVEALEILSSGVPTLRCSWGVPSETGLATNVSLVDAAQSAALATALTNAGFACGAREGGTVCTFEQTVVDREDDHIIALAETHVLRGNAWISTASIDFAPEGYTEDIVATLWG